MTVIDKKTEVGLHYHKLAVQFEFKHVMPTTLGDTDLPFFVAHRLCHA